MFNKFLASKLATLALCSTVTIHAEPRLSQISSLANPIPKPVAKPAAKTPASALSEMKTDRLAILNQERNALTARFAAAQTSGDKANSSRLINDLQSIDREIATTLRDTPFNAAASTAAALAVIPTATFQLRPVPQAQAAKTPPTDEAITFAQWDIFKNFGQKGTTNDNDK